MSGGYFSYQQYTMECIADEIEEILNNQGKPKVDSYYDGEYYKKYPEEKYHPTYPEKIQEEMKKTVNLLRIAAVYVQRLDWYLSGDDGEESFYERLEEELKGVEKRKL